MYSSFMALPLMKYAFFASLYEINHGISIPKIWISSMYVPCYDIKPVRKEEGKSYWKILLCDDDATREK